MHRKTPLQAHTSGNRTEGVRSCRTSSKKPIAGLHPCSQPKLPTQMEIGERTIALAVGACLILRPLEEFTESPRMSFSGSLILLRGHGDGGGGGGGEKETHVEAALLHRRRSGVSRTYILSAHKPIRMLRHLHSGCEKRDYGRSMHLYPETAPSYTVYNWSSWYRAYNFTSLRRTSYTIQDR